MAKMSEKKKTLTFERIVLGMERRWISTSELIERKKACHTIKNDQF